LIAWIKRGGRRDDEWGVLATELFENQPGLEYLLKPRPKGKFLLPDDNRDVIMVATGTGLAPFVSILRNQNRLNDYRNYFIIHGVSKHSVLSFKEELRNFENLHVTYHRTVSREKCEDCHKSYVD
jgi:ferredoxin--NADP+ reductase